jgi:hypothetical protein
VCLTQPELEEPLLETNPTLICELLVGLPDVNVIGVRIAITTRGRSAGLSRVRRRGVDEVKLADLPCFGRRTRLV